VEEKLAQAICFFGFYLCVCVCVWGGGGHWLTTYNHLFRRTDTERKTWWRGGNWCA